MRWVLIFLLCVAYALLGLLATGCRAGSVKSNTELVKAPVVATSNDNFNEGAAVAGALMHGNQKNGGISLGGGVLWGMAMAEGCKIVVEVDAHKERLSAPSTACRALKAGSLAPVRRDTYTYYDEKGLVTGVSVYYSWDYN